jgi:hypothetical protein
MMSGANQQAFHDSGASRGLIVVLSAIPLAVQLIGLTTAGYSYFIDEFYYFACAGRLAFGYVDHPPLAPLVLAATRSILGDSLLAIRIVPFLAASATVWLTCLLVARLGGGRVATVIAALGIGLAPLSLGMVDSIDRVAADRIYYRLFTRDGEFTRRGTMADIEQRLDPERFLRINRSEIVRLEAVAEFQPWFHGDCRVRMKDGTMLTWSRRFRARSDIG